MAAKNAHQAVILIHGMGEQIPMDTIKRFVSSAWQADTAIHGSERDDPSQVWSKPDDRTGSLELRRLTTRESVHSDAFPGGVRTDFYELYWADLTAGSTWEQFTGWIRYLLLRPPSKVPPRVFSAWILLWFAAAAVVLMGSMSLIPEAVWRDHVTPWLPQKLLLALAAAALAGLHYMATRTFGRVVRYTRADPDNIAARKAVRERGLQLLRALHADDSYSRIVVVGHSLGTILAHDLVSYYWAEQSSARNVQTGTSAFTALAAVEVAAEALDASGWETASLLRDAYRKAQAKLRRELAARPPLPKDTTSRWLITDLVTLGAPLAHAQVLLANDTKDLGDRIVSRELPSCPPVREKLDKQVLAAAVANGELPIATAAEATRLMCYPGRAGTNTWTLHHAAPFAVVRWTNVYDSARLIYRGDIISGPVAPNFGPGIEDTDLAVVDRPSAGFTHTRYWDPTQPTMRLDAMRGALNLLDN